MSEATTTNSTNPAHSPRARKQAMHTRNSITIEQKQAIALEATGKNGKELIALAKKHGVSRSSVDVWRKTWGSPGAPLTGTLRGKSTAPAVRREVLARWRASGQSLFTWAKANGYAESTMRAWLGRKGPVSKRGGRVAGRANYSAEFKRQTVERSRHMEVRQLAKETGVSETNISRWRRAAGESSKRGANQHGRDADASPLHPADQALLEDHTQQKARDKNLHERVRLLEKENIVLRANLAYAIEAGYLDLFNLDRMFTKKG